ncbi:NUDIX domain-containing protein [Streptomyces sp. HMX112]|uniref:NUDIX domain-containing protein n=1 Tax=Streptomyces sp. HMX112 TaxID=3390850 RepID=UPI003A806934
MTAHTSGQLPTVKMAPEAYGALRASIALWAGTSVLSTNRSGQVLLQRVSYRPTRLLPGGAVAPGESPAQGTARELEEELGVTATVTRRLAVDRVFPAGRATPLSP